MYVLLLHMDKSYFHNNVTANYYMVFHDFDTLIQSYAPGGASCKHNTTLQSL